MPKIPSQLQQIKDLIAREVARQKAAPAVTQYASGAGVPSLPVTPTPTVVSSDDVPEGQTNLYFTDERAQAAVQPGEHIYAASSAGTDAYAITLDPAPDALTVGMVIHFLADVANTGAATLNVNAIGAATIKKRHDADLADNDIEAGQIVTVAWDGTYWQMQSQVATAPTGDVAADTHAASEKTPPHNDDEMPLVDSENSWSLKKITWANIKAALKTYFDTLYLLIPGSSAQGDILYRDGSGWTRLPAGTVGYVLKTQGAAANPQWGAESGDVAASIHAADSKATPHNDDELGLVDTEAANVLKRLTWTNLKATLKTYFDTLYLLIPESSAQGDILYRSDTGWVRLAAGTSGHFLKTLGAGANPQWDAPTASAAWGSITGTLSSQTDLQNALNAKTSTHTDTVDPTVDDDSTAGYAAGWRWINTATGDTFTCADATEGAAVWKQENNEASPRNLLANGGFDIAQRMVAPATGFIPGDGNYALDRWYVLTNNGAHITASQGSGPTSTARYSGLLTNDAATGKFGMAQILEGGECMPLREQMLQAQLQLKCSENSATLVMALLEWSGTIDEPTADVVNDWADGTLEPGNFFIAGVTVLGIDTQESTADTWHTLSCTGTPSTSCTNLYLFWAVIDDVDTGYVAATAADLFVGSETRAWAPVSLAEDLARCQRYCFVPKADNSFRRIGQRYGTKYINMIRYECPVTMRATPGVTSNISGWQASTTPTTTNVAFYNNEADALATITGALAVLPQLISADGFYFGFSAGTSFSGTAGQWGTFIPGPDVRIIAEAELGE